MRNSRTAILAASAMLIGAALLAGTACEPAVPTQGVTLRLSTGWTVAQALTPDKPAVALTYRLSRGMRADALLFRVRDSAGNKVHEFTERGRIGRRGSAAWDGVGASGAPLGPGNYTVELEARLAGKPLGRSQRQPLRILSVDLDVDTNRDGKVTQADDAGEDRIADQSGAYFSVNFDADGSRRTASGLALQDALRFDDDAGEPMDLDGRIENDADRDGTAPLVIRAIAAGGGALPPDARVFLRAGEYEDVESIQVYARRAAGAQRIWGGPGKRAGEADQPTEIDITRYVNPAAPEYAGPPDANGDLTFAVEGLFFRNTVEETSPFANAPVILINPFDGDIDLYLDIRYADDPHETIYSDHVRMRVTPWLMLPSTNPTDHVFAIEIEGDADNTSFVNVAAPGYHALAETGQLTVVRYSEDDEKRTVSQWFQDHAKIGFYHLPGTGADQKTYATFRLPYELDDGLVQPDWVQEYLMGPDRGTFQFGREMGRDHGDEEQTGGSVGGNFELIPPSADYPLGRILAGDTMSAELYLFLESQRVQPIMRVPTRWLTVGHLDEILGFTGRGGEAAIADPLLAYRLLDAIPPEQRGARVFFAKSARTATYDARAARDDPAVRLETGADHRGQSYRYVRIYQDAGSGAAGQVARIAPGGLHNGYLLVDKVWNTATTFLPGAVDEPSVYDQMGVDEEEEDEEAGPDTVNSRAGWFRIPGAGDKAVLVEDTQFWLPGLPAVITVQEVLADADLRRFNTRDVADRIREVRRILERDGGRDERGAPFVRFTLVPVLFVGEKGKTFIHGRTAGALTPDLANFQLVAGKLYMPRQYGPRDESGVDIFERAAREALGARVRFVDDWDVYHRRGGSVHCATNVLRKHFPFDWWRHLPARKTTSGKHP